jgi:hypothetical protein
MLMLLDPIGEIAQRIRQAAHGGYRLAPNLRNHRVINIGDRVTEFHLDQFDGLFNAAAYAPRTRRRICAHNSRSAFRKTDETRGDRPIPSLARAILTVNG